MGNFNPNYFDRKAGSLERAVLDAINGVQSQINEKVEYVEYEFKNEKDAKAAKSFFDGIQLMGFEINDDNISSGELGVEADGGKDMTKYHKEVMKKFKPKVMTQEKMDAVGKEDGDIDNDGDKDASDKYLAKRRKTISKAIKNEAVDLDEAMYHHILKGKVVASGSKSDMMKLVKKNGAPSHKGADSNYVMISQDAKVGEFVVQSEQTDDFKTHMMYDPKTGKGYEAKTMEDHLRMKKMGYDHKKPNSESFESQGESDWNETVSIIQKKQTSMREALAKVWGFDEGHNPFKKEEKVPKGSHRMPDGSLMKDSDMDKKENKTMTGKSATKVTVDPDMKKD